MKYFDYIGNEIKVGDEVLVLVPKSDASYRRAVIVGFRNAWERDNYFHCEVLVEYWCERLYCTVPHWKLKSGEPVDFTKKITKAWRSNSDIILYKENIMNKYDR